MNHQHAPKGYCQYRDLLLPNDVVLMLLRDLRETRDVDHQADAGRSLDPPADGSADDAPNVTPPTPPARRRRSRSPVMRRVFQLESVEDFAEKTESTARSSERRKTMEGMLKSLQRDPMGLRTVATVPRNVQQLLASLEAEMPNFSEVITCIRSILQLQQLGDKAIQLPPMLLGGDPGVGKTYFAMRLAKLLGVHGEVVNMETASASFILTGADLTWGNGAPGRVFDVLVRGGFANPLLVLDEVDKAGGAQRYNPVNSLYTLLEPGTAKEFRDESCPEVPLDVTGFNWILTANEVDQVPGPLRNRMREFAIPMPTPAQRVQIAHCVYRDMRREHGWGRWFAPALGDATAKALVDLPGSVRTMRTVLLDAFACAYQRGSKRVLPSDVSAKRMIPESGNYGSQKIGFLKR